MIHKVTDNIDVPILHILAIGLTFTDIESYLKIISLLLAIGYTAWKWSWEYRKKKNK